MVFLNLFRWPYRFVAWIFRARPIRFTPFGWYYLFFSLAVGAAAINTGNNLLYLILGLLLGLIIISGLLSDSCLWGARFDLTPAGDLFAGRASTWEVRLTKGWFPAVIYHLDLFWQGITPPSHALFAWVPSRGTGIEQITVQPLRRGYLTLERIRTASTFPFGLFEKSHRHADGRRWIVYPEIRPVPLRLLRAFGAARADRAAARRGVGAIPFDLREFQEGDSSKRIHWKTSAKRGQWMVAEMEDEAGPSQTLLVSSWPVREEVESFISFVASFAFMARRNGYPVGLATPGFRVAPDRSSQTLQAILRYLALVDPTNEPVGGIATARRGVDLLSLWKEQR